MPRLSPPREGVLLGDRQPLCLSLGSAEESPVAVPPRLRDLLRCCAWPLTCLAYSHPRIVWEIATRTYQRSGGQRAASGSGHAIPPVVLESRRLAWRIFCVGPESASSARARSTRDERPMILAHRSARDAQCSDWLSSPATTTSSNGKRSTNSSESPRARSPSRRRCRTSMGADSRIGRRNTQSCPVGNSLAVCSVPLTHHPFDEIPRSSRAVSSDAMGVHLITDPSTIPLTVFQGMAAPPSSAAS